MASQKRKIQYHPADGDKNAMSATIKRPRLEYGDTLTISVISAIGTLRRSRALPRPESQRNFTVHEDILIRNSPYFAQQVAEHPGKRRFELLNVDAELFRAYLDYLYRGEVTVESVRGGSGKMLDKLSSAQSLESRKAAGTINRLCKLLILAQETLQDTEFARRVLALLKEQPREPTINSRVSLELSHANHVLVAAKPLLDHDLSMLISSLVVWTAPGLTRVMVEQLRASIQKDFLEGLREALPTFTAFNVGSGPDRRCFTVDKKNLRSRTLSFPGWPTGYETATFELPEFSPTAFESYLEYIKTGHILYADLMTRCEYQNKNGVWVPKHEADCCTLMRKLCELWLLADFLGDIRGRTDTMCEILQLEKASRSALSHDIIRMISTRADPDSHLSCWLIDTWSVWPNMKCVENMNVQDLPPWLWKRLFTKATASLQSFQGKQACQDMIPGVDDLPKYC